MKNFEFNTIANNDRSFNTSKALCNVCVSVFQYTAL